MGNGGRGNQVILYIGVGMSGGEGAIEHDPSESDSDWLSEPASSSHSPFQDQQQPQEGGGQAKGSRWLITEVTAMIKRTKGVSGRSAGSELVEFKVYPWRWFMLATLCLLNTSNGMVGRIFAYSYHVLAISIQIMQHV